MKKNPRKRILPIGVGRAIDGIRKEDARGLLYYMDYRADYYKLEKYTAMLTASGCSTFLTKNEEGNYLLGRNYDFSHYRFNQKGGPEDITSLIIVVRTDNPKAKYRTLGIVDGFWLDFAKGSFFEGVPSDGVTNMTRLAMAPFVIMDGVNEAGLATSIMHLPTENDWNEVAYRSPDSLDEKEKEIAKIYEKSGERPDRFDITVKNNALAINTADRLTWQADKNHAVDQHEEGKPTVLHPILMRKMLDQCGNVDEAIELAKTFNMKSPLPDNDYHIMLADRSGKSVILEWVNNELKIIETAHGTNYYLGREDRYGYGMDRDEIVAKTLSEKQFLTEKEAMDLLEEVSQNPFKGKYVGFTQWSGVYDLSRASLKLSIFLDYDKSFDYQI